MNFKKPSVLILRNFVFGVEDSLASTLGLVSGVAVAGLGRSEILITGTILIFVESFSMGIGSLLSEHMAEEYSKQAVVSMRRSARGAVAMFISYFISGFIPLLPYIVMGVNSAFWVSIAASLLTLFFLGTINARLSSLKIWHNSFEMLLIGGIAMVVGIIVGISANLLKY